MFEFLKRRCCFGKRLLRRTVLNLDPSLMESRHIWLGTGCTSPSEMDRPSSLSYCLFVLVLNSHGYNFFTVFGCQQRQNTHGSFFWSELEDCSTQPTLLFVPHARGLAYEKFMRALMGLDVSNGALLHTASPGNCNPGKQQQLLSRDDQE